MLAMMMMMLSFLYQLPPVLHRLYRIRLVSSETALQQKTRRIKRRRRSLFELRQSRNSSIITKRRAPVCCFHLLRFDDRRPRTDLTRYKSKIFQLFPVFLPNLKYLETKHFWNWKIVCVIQWSGLEDETRAVWTLWRSQFVFVCLLFTQVVDVLCYGSRSRCCWFEHRLALRRAVLCCYGNTLLLLLLPLSTVFFFFFLFFLTAMLSNSTHEERAGSRVYKDPATAAAAAVFIDPTGV